MIPSNYLRIILLLILSSASVWAQQKPLITYKNCTLQKTDWADGDSFRVKTENGEEFTFRLYGADCIERHISTDSDKNRLRNQRRHFGITDVKGEYPSSVELAKGFGNIAAEFTAKRLEEKFTVHTRLSKAPGDGKHERFYAFIELTNEVDLAKELVVNGLARAQGRATLGAKGISSERYKQTLADLELQAARNGKGVWKFTNWDNLWKERDQQRKDEEDDEFAEEEPLPKDFRLNPNLASRDDLDKLPHIGPALAERILEEREEARFEEPKDLMRVQGIKQKTLDKIKQYLDFKIP